MTTAASLPTEHPLRTLASISRLHIVAIGALGTLTFGWLFTGTRPYLLAAISGLDWMLVNLLNRVVDVPEDRANGIVGTDFVARHRLLLLVGGFVVLGGSLLATSLYMARVTALRVAFHLLGLAYNWPLLPGGRRIKQLYFWKNTASATGFMLTVFAYPLVAARVVHDVPLAHGITPATVLVAAVFFFLFELSYEVIYDLRDAPGDAAVGVRTYPVVHGERRATQIVDGLIVASMLALVAGAFLHVVPVRLFIMIAAPIAQLVYYKRALARGIQSTDCIRLTWIGAALLLGYHGWVLAKLPWWNA